MIAGKRILAVIAVAMTAAAGLGFAASGSAVAQTVADRCFEHHKFGQEPVPVAKTTDGAQVLAEVQWGWNDSIGCYLVLDTQAINTLRANAASLTPPAPFGDEASDQCFERHEFGRESVPVAKTADGTTVLAQVQWGWQDSIGCFLVLDNQAVDALRAAAAIPVPTFAAIAVGRTSACGLLFNQTIQCWGSNSNGQTNTPEGQFTAVTAGSFHSCALHTDQTIQ
ncbi:MAG: hypothetical protein KTV68_19440, partial [Acidimicrobiia bacterium]|nr:hypothetical protein [Acidimicrobiia bacterium]